MTDGESKTLTLAAYVAGGLVLALALGYLAMVVVAGLGLSNGRSVAIVIDGERTQESGAITVHLPPTDGPIELRPLPIGGLRPADDGLTGAGDGVLVIEPSGCQSGCSVSLVGNQRSGSHPRRDLPGPRQRVPR